MGNLSNVRKLVILTRREIATDRALTDHRFPKSIEKNDLLMITEGVKDIPELDTVYQIAIQRGYLVETKMAPTQDPHYAVSVSEAKASKLLSRAGFLEIYLEEYNRTISLLIALLAGAGIGSLVIKGVEALVELI